jgi:hypothetical protein
MEITLDTNKGMGFGDMLCLISLLCDVTEPITLYSNNRETYYDRLKHLTKMLNVPESKLKILPTENEGNFSGAYHVRTVSEYFYPDHLTIDGKRIKVNDPSRKKTFVGLCMYNGDGFIDKDWNFWRNNEHLVPVNEGSSRTDRIPQCKWRSIEYYSKIFAMLRRCDYEVITFDQQTMMEPKIRFMLEHCNAVIGYEGGMAHLCHMLKIPYLMFKYRPSPDVDDLYGPFTQESIHRGAYTHFVEDDETLINLNKRDLETIITNLKQGIHNNRLVKGEVNMIFDKGISSNVSFVDKNNNVLYRGKFGPQMSVEASNFINKFYQHRFPNL